ncbi:MAG: HTH domain-containing protein [Hungatella sp.]
MSGQKLIAWRLKRKDQPMLTKRQNHIIDILNSEHRPVTGKELGKILGVSDRTIRTDVEGINSEYACKLILANRRSGYQVDYDLMKQHNIERKEAIPQTALQRRAY